MKVAIIHYWWVTNRGGEAVVKAISELYPQADIFLHVYDQSLVEKTLGDDFKGKVMTTFINKLPGARKHYQKYLPLMPLALEQLDLTDYDLIISSESGPAKGVITRPDALHVCYCHSPMRYIWDMYHGYLAGAGKVIRLLFPLIAHWLRVWDRASADRVDLFLANSTFIQSRIQKFYRTKSQVLFPPVNVNSFDHTKQRADFYLCLGQLVPYKRTDLAVEVFNSLGLNLIIIGEGEQYELLKEKAKPNVKVLGKQSFDVVKAHLETCKALVFPGVEDFGIVPVEAMAAGAPVIAFKKGGVLDSVVDQTTGVFFEEQTIESLREAVLKVEDKTCTFNSETLKDHASKFDKIIFQTKLKAIIDNALQSQI